MSASNAGPAILGAGIFAKEAHLPALQTLGPPAPKLKAVYSRSEKSARELAAQATALLDTTPDPSIVLRALAAGKHVLSEKPVAADAASGVKLIAQYEAQYKPKGLVWRVAENWEAEPGHIAAGRAIAAGKIGKVTFFSSRTVNFMDQGTKWYTSTFGLCPRFNRISIKEVSCSIQVCPEKEEVIDEPLKGIELEQASFFAALKGKDDGLGSPLSALKDVAVIEAALTSGGEPIDLEKLLSQF
ncbi:uncharacterized protein BJ212DRAFT_1484294 [Suillus subaureus]|uniref:Gfo/Idh/MocA-like oxidoreductase N-terminal domain-containing protein n=1 Tax=Suillus subaureus TaxID=48587 RepID=A0A9P7J9E8_9AGAM|nr:uncharacterized protein BJ212DRAFT_1484294 [Suillus subaureus]KAG1809583.1 hypothetical protein BJ212DRAFT_1484294 [Suillus subaureus]